jgi:mono/diheme cytochrome c family protein
MAEQDADPARGQELFQFYCSSCHGGDGSGNGPVAPALRAPPADLRRIAARRGGSFPADEVAAYIDGRRDMAAHGTREMPVWGRVLGEKFRRRDAPESAVAGEIRLLVVYLESIQVLQESDESRP